MTSPEEILSRYWGFTSFRPFQKEIITSVLNGRDTVGLLPTGGGKSLCFQIPSLATEGICIVISPLVALMQDQVRSLTEKGIKAINLSGGISFEQLNVLLDNALYGNYKFLYLSPERLGQEIVQNYIRQMNVNLIAVDEAHCISQWGNDFRPAYKQIVKLRELQPLVPVVALTATATPEVLEDTIKELQLELPEVFVQSFVRQNISYRVLEEDDKIHRTIQLLKNNNGSAIVYLRNRKATVEISAQLNSFGITASYFHGGLTTKEKNEKLKSWMSGEISTIVATNAFGMGIDNPHVRYVIHLQTPESLESYFQEAGRAGRDGVYSEAILIHSPGDEKVVENQFISSLPTTEDLKLIYRKLNNYLQVPYGEGQFIRHPFHFGDFVKTYKLPSALTYNTLKSFDRAGILQLSEEFDRKTVVQYILAAPNLFSYFQRDPKVSVIGKAILRLYEGIFDLPITIDLQFLSSKTGQSPETIISVLEQMERDKVIELRLANTDSAITFIEPREDDRTINRIAPEIKAVNRKKIDQVRAVISYVKNTDTCRSIQLVRYFGEKQNNPCGICSVCTARLKTEKKESISEIAEAILLYLKEAPLTSKELIKDIRASEEAVLKTLRLLTDKGQIKINIRNQYYIP